MATYVFGAIGATNVAEGTYGLLQSFNTVKTSDEANAQDEDGNTALQNFYNGVTEKTAEYVYDSLTSLPSIGDTIKIGATDNYAVTNVDETESNSDYKKATIKFKKYTGISGGLPANA